MYAIVIIHEYKTFYLGSVSTMFPDRDDRSKRITKYWHSDVGMAMRFETVDRATKRYNDFVQRGLLNVGAIGVVSID